LDKKYYSLKNKFGLRFRIGLLTTLILLILGFIFFPEIERNNTQYFELNPYIIPSDTFEHYIKLINIRELNPVIPDSTQYELRKIWNEPFPYFVLYDETPKPLNLDEINFEYPENLKPLGLEGIVFLELWINKDGRVINVIKMTSIHPDLDKIAVENAWKIKFSPAMQRDKPVAIRYSFPVKFKLE